MKIISKEEVIENQDFFIEEILKGKIFIYPTDTLYGVGCDATNSMSVKQIREIKKRELIKPFSIIIPSKEWIFENCIVNQEHISKFDKLPGPYTFILKLKNYNAIAKNDLIGDFNSIGIRMPNNWFSNLIYKSDIPFVTTSVNLSGEPSAICFNDIPKSIANKVDYVIKDDISLSGKASKIIDLSSNELKVLRE